MKTLRVLAPFLALGLVLALPTTVPATDIAGPQVVLNGLPLFQAVSSLKATVDLVEYRDGSDPDVVRLLPGPKRFTVCILSRGPVKMLDAELPLADVPDRFTVEVEDGRELSGCLLAEAGRGEPPVRDRLHAARDGAAYRYCLRCEDVTTPVSIP